MRLKESRHQPHKSKGWTPSGCSMAPGRRRSIYAILPERTKGPMVSSRCTRVPSRPVYQPLPKFSNISGINQTIRLFSTVPVSPSYPKLPLLCAVAYCISLEWTIADQFHLIFTAGKDRTGILAALILLLMGGLQHEIINDYILTRAGLENVRENFTQALAFEGTDRLSPEAIGMLE